VNVHCSGEFLSGPEEIDSNRRREELVELYPNAIAVEMDGQGMVMAVLFDCLVLSRNPRQNYTHDVGQRNMDSGLRTPDSGLRTPDSGLRTPDSGLWKLSGIRKSEKEYRFFKYAKDTLHSALLPVKIKRPSKKGLKPNLS